jgi:hypothetical protein
MARKAGRNISGLALFRKRQAFRLFDEAVWTVRFQPVQVLQEFPALAPFYLLPLARINYQVGMVNPVMFPYRQTKKRLVSESF